MREPLKTVSEIIARSNDSLYQKHPHIDTIIGIMDKALRQQGMNSDAITIECPAQNKKIVFLLHDEKPDYISIAVGDKTGNVETSSEIGLENFSETMLMVMLEMHFT
ncbi:hypothetical protein [Litorilituus lipolyticus]|uniref:Uncharacterized protein n=1 Tax=Litorilituus lipolyticus TaxID=2491017 RepID=A0A502KUD3_9GAMM|nr:hypothetical protein [Litorilituus lipolyticus]TPH14039.1 hypothetical protein EPA86_13110 [Litorilituus lipolyticus]